VFLQIDIARLLATLVFVFVNAGSVNAHVLIEHQGTTYRTQADTFAPLARVVVGPADVHIGGFGVYGQTSVGSNLKWAIFDAADAKSPVFLSAPQAVEASAGSFASNAQWYDSPAVEFTLLANHRYAMGVLSDRLGPMGFRWGVSLTESRYGGGGPAIEADGFAMPFGSALANAGLAGSFYSTPFVYTFNGVDPLQGNSAIQPSLRIMSAIAEPPEWVMLLTGLIVIGWVSRQTNRRRKQHQPA
jgi:hypothetical protein